MTRTTKSYLSIIFLMVVTWSGPAFSNDDLYLKELEAEVDDEVDTQPSGAGQKKSSPQSVQRKDFEEKLYNELPTTFRTYRMLPEEDKLKVVEIYLGNDKDMTMATRLLFELYYK